MKFDEVQVLGRRGIEDGDNRCATFEPINCNYVLAAVKLELIIRL